MPRLASSWLLTVFLLLFPVSGHAETYFETAQRMLQQGQETEARRALELEISLRPRNLEARYDLAVLLERIGHDNEAAALYRENLKRGRHLPSVVNLAALLLSQGRLSEAESLLEKATQTYRAEAVPWYLLAGIAQKKGNVKQADALYRSALKADDKNGFAHLRYARFLAEQGRFDVATVQAEEAMHLLPACADCLNIAGDIFKQVGKNKQALVLWQKSMALEPNNALGSKILHALDDARRTR